MDRIILLAAFALISFVAYIVLQRWQLKKAKEQATVDPLLSTYSMQQPTVVFFTTPLCQACKYQQLPILNRMVNTYGIQVIQVDATEEPEAASRWGVMTAPTTFILNRMGEVLFVNNGMTDEYILKQQLGLSA